MPNSSEAASDPATVVLVGAGHTHTLVLERWAKRPPEGARVTVVTERTELVYSGMIPGRIAREYRPDDTVIDAARLTRQAGGRLLERSVTAVDTVARRLELESGDTVTYDVASLDIGSGPAGLDGVEDATLVVPARAVERLESRLEPLEGQAVAPRLVVVGGGAAGVEVAAALSARLGIASPRTARSGTQAEGRASGNRGQAEFDNRARGRLSLLEEANRLMAGYHPRVSERARRALEERGVDVRVDSTVSAVRAASEPATSDPAATSEPRASPNPSAEAEPPVGSRQARALVTLESGEHLESDLVIWATGASAPPLLRRSGLPVDEDGFVRVDPTLRVAGRNNLFAVGDCVSFEMRELPKAGVHAVRQAPVLFDNLVRTLGSRDVVGARGARGSGRDGRSSDQDDGLDLRRYEPQADFLTLLNLGDGTALGTKWGFVVEGRWVRWLKDLIDRRFVERFR